MSRKRINRCVECNAPLKHIANNKWMCDQSPSNCSMSIKVIFLDNPEKKDEEECPAVSCMQPYINGKTRGIILL